MPAAVARLKSFHLFERINPSDGLLARFLLRTNFPTIAGIILVLLWSASASYFVWRSEMKSAQQEFAATAESQSLTLQKGVEEYLNKIEALAALFESSDHEVSRLTFERFANRLLHAQAPIQSMSWIPRVLQSERDAVEAAAIRDGIPSYTIKTVAADGSLAPSPIRDEYFPILYSTETPKTSPVYGIDLNSGVMRRRTVERARDSGMIATSAIFGLHSGQGDLHGFFVVRPVYALDRPHDSVSDRQRYLVGFVQAAFQISLMVDTIMAPTASTAPVKLFLFSGDSGPNDPPIYSRVGSATIEPETTLATISADRSHWASQLRIGDMHLTLELVPRTDGSLARRYELAMLVLLAGVLVGLLLILYIRSSVHHAQSLVRANEEISKLALKDSLTGLFNRRAFNDKLAAAFQANRCGDPPFAVLYFDLDHFKDVNDTLGHPIGDLLLQQVSRRVQHVVRTGDILARSGGDEFAILLLNADERQLIKIASRINQVLAAPFVIGGSEVHVTASIGIAQYTPQVATPEMLIIQADLALYRAKRDGRNCYRFHSVELDSELRERMTTADKLPNTIQCGSASASSSTISAPVTHC
jgi:diguanylate cyclase (GGDEF)-like protein